MSTDSPGTRRVFALTRLSVYGDTFKVEGIKPVPYQTVSRDMILLFPPDADLHEDFHQWRTNTSEDTISGGWRHCCYPVW